jgi:hypothetical protein
MQTFSQPGMQSSIHIHIDAMPCTLATIYNQRNQNTITPMQNPLKSHPSILQSLKQILHLGQ